MRQLQLFDRVNARVRIGQQVLKVVTFSIPMDIPECSENIYPSTRYRSHVGMNSYANAKAGAKPDAHGRNRKI